MAIPPPTEFGITFWILLLLAFAGTAMCAVYRNREKIGFAPPETDVDEAGVTLGEPPHSGRGTVQRNVRYIGPLLIVVAFLGTILVYGIELWPSILSDIGGDLPNEKYAVLYMNILFLSLSVVLSIVDWFTAYETNQPANILWKVSGALGPISAAI